MRVILVGHSLAHSLTLSSTPATPEMPEKVISSFKVASKTFASTTKPQTSITSSAPVLRSHRRSRRGSTTSDQASISLIGPEMTGQQAGTVFKFTEMPGHPLLAAASGIPADCERLFVGWSGPVLDESGKKVDVNNFDPERLDQIRTSYQNETGSIPVFLPEDCARGYLDFCKSTLWPILHYQIWDDPAQCIIKMEQQWSEFLRANEAFAEAILNVFQSGDVIWILDYHLMLLPGLLRRKLQTTPIGFFFRTTFPSSEMIRCLPQATELMTGVLGANLIGFQIYAFARHFTSCCTRILGIEASLQQVDFGGAPSELSVVSTGVDPEETHEWLKNEETVAKVTRFTEMYRNYRLIVGVDRIYQVRGLKHKLTAFEMFLQDHPEWIGKVVLIQILLPESSDSGPNSDLSEFLDEVARVNSKFGSLEYTPFQLFQQNIELSEYYALLQVADCYISTKERDSLSMVPLDFILCQEFSKRHGPIVLSEFTALANALSTCLRINPWDHAETAKSINQALNMSNEEKHSRHKVLLEFTLKHTRQEWSKSFFESLMKTRETIQKYSATQYLDLKTVKEVYQQARDCYFFLDYDGTLTPIVKTPSAARPSQATLDSLRGLVQNLKNKVFVISGRDQATLEAWLGEIDGLGMSAEHGCFLKMPGSTEWTDLIADHNEDWKASVTQVFEYFTERTSGSFIEHKRASITWHYRQCDPDFGSWQARQCQSLLESTVVGKLPVEILAGKKNLEVRPVSVNKGQTLMKILSEGRESIQADFVFCAGDDRTDEDMFEALISVTEGCKERIAVITCAIGPAEKRTLAKFHLNNPEQLVQSLKILNDM